MQINHSLKCTLYAQCVLCDYVVLVLCNHYRPQPTQHQNTIVIKKIMNFRNGCVSCGSN